MDEDETADWRNILADLGVANAAFRRTVDRIDWPGALWNAPTTHPHENGQSRWPEPQQLTNATGRSVAAQARELEGCRCAVRRVSRVVLSSGRCALAYGAPSGPRPVTRPPEKHAAPALPHRATHPYAAHRIRHTPQMNTPNTFMFQITKLRAD